MNFELISPSEMKKIVRDSDVLIIDLRDPETYVKGHLKGAVNIPYERLEKNLMLPMDMQLVLYCERGTTSLRAAKLLADRGYQVKSMVGGYQGYRSYSSIANDPRNGYVQGM